MGHGSRTHSRTVLLRIQLYTVQLTSRPFAVRTLRVLFLDSVLGVALADGRRVGGDRASVDRRGGPL